MQYIAPFLVGGVSAPIAQWIEHLSSKQWVGSSNLSGGAIAIRGGVMRNPDFCKKSPNGSHDWEFIGVVKRGGKEVEFYTCHYCGGNMYV